MKNLILSIFCYFVMSVTAYSQTGVSRDNMETFYSDLENKGVTQTEVINIKSPVSTLLSKGVSRQKLFNAVIDLKTMDIRGRVLSDCVLLISNLIKSGTDADNAVDLVKREAKNALAKELKGKNLFLCIKQQALLEK